MTTQLRLVDTEAITPTPPTVAPDSGRRRPVRARVTPRVRGARRAAHWHSEWRLDDQTRRVGQQGIAAARVALARAQQADEGLAQAS